MSVVFVLSKVSDVSCICVVVSLSYMAKAEVLICEYLPCL